MTERRPFEPLWTRDYVLCLLSAVVMFAAFHSLLPTLPIYIKRLGGSVGVAGASLGLLTLSAVLIRPVSGRALDSGARKLVLTAGLVIFLVPALAYPWVKSIPVLLGWRFLHGFGWGVAATAASTVAADLVPRSRLGEGMAIFSATSTASLALSPALSLWVTDRYGFPALFACGAALTGLSLCLALALRLPPVPRRNKGLRPALLEPAALGPAAVTFCVTMTYGSLLSFLALFAKREGFGSAGVFFTAAAVCTLLTRSFSGRLTDRKGYDVVVVPGLLLILAAMSLVSRTGSPAGLVASGAFYGVGFGAVQPALLALSLRNAPPERRGAATGTYWTAFDLGVAVGSLLWGCVADGLGYRWMFLLNAVPGALGLSMFFELSRRERKATRIPVLGSLAVPGAPVEAP